MESINDCFLLEKELRGVVQKGMRGNAGAVEYLEEVRVHGIFTFRLRHITSRINLPGKFWWTNSLRHLALSGFQEGVHGIFRCCRRMRN